MKRILKGLFTLFIIVALTALCAVSVFAEEVRHEAEDSIITEDEGGNGAVTEGTETTAEGSEDSGTVNPFESFYETVINYASEIFCLITLIVSLLLSYAYKRGLVPLVKGAIGALGGAVGELRESADKESGQIEALSEGTSEKMKQLEESLASLTDKLGGVAVSLARMASDKSERERASEVLTAQTEMIYDLLMTSALPAYQKEAIGEKMQRMKEKINECKTGRDEAESH